MVPKMKSLSSMVAQIWASKNMGKWRSRGCRTSSGCNIQQQLITKVVGAAKAATIVVAAVLEAAAVE